MADDPIQLTKEELEIEGGRKLILYSIKADFPPNKLGDQPSSSPPPDTPQR